MSSITNVYIMHCILQAGRTGIRISILSIHLSVWVFPKHVLINTAGKIIYTSVKGANINSEEI